MGKLTFNATVQTFCFRWDLVCTEVPKLVFYLQSGGSKEGARDAPRVQFLSFLCSFQKNFGQIMGWCPYLGGWEILDRPLLHQGESNQIYPSGQTGMTLGWFFFCVIRLIEFLKPIHIKEKPKINATSLSGALSLSVNEP